jgi:beta-phosphoglucomutase
MSGTADPKPMVRFFGKGGIFTTNTLKKMDNKRPIAALFDLDGVVFNTEPQYSIFWGDEGKKYLPGIEHFEQRIKGQTLVQIYDKYFKDDQELQASITEELNRFERNMQFPWVPGICEFLAGLRENNIRTAIVTSSDMSKMNNVYNAVPQIKQMFDEILTAEMFSRSKPCPDCYILGSNMFGTVAENCIVFEDSFNGLKAGRAANMLTIGIATTNRPVDIAPLADYVIEDFSHFCAADVFHLLEERVAVS